MGFDDYFDFRAMMAGAADAPLNARPVEYLCRVPADLGAVTRLRKLNGRIVAETTSGIPMIVPQRAALV